VTRRGADAAPIYYAHRLVERQAQLRRDGRMPYLRPDAKSQITMRYVVGKPHSIDTVVLSSQHAREMSDGKTMKKEFVEGGNRAHHQAGADRPSGLKNTRYLVNPTAASWCGGPQGDCGLTAARSSSIPMVAPAARRRRVFGQGSVQGRSLGAYARVTIARTGRRRPRAASASAGRLRDRCRQADEHHHLQREGTGVISDEAISRSRSRALRPAAPRHRADAESAAAIYEKTAAYGHFGRDEPEFSWERADKAACWLTLRYQAPRCAASGVARAAEAKTVPANTPGIANFALTSAAFVCRPVLASAAASRLRTQRSAALIPATSARQRRLSARSL